MEKVVGKLLHVDMATKNKSRPSCAKVKVKVDLLREFPKRIKVGIKKANSGEIISTWTNIRYDHMPKYCKYCKLQGHRESECFVLHPELQETYTDDELEGEQTQDGTRTLTSGKVVGPPNKDFQGIELEEENKAEIRAYNRRRDNYHRNHPKQKWNITKDKRILTPNRGVRSQQINNKEQEAGLQLSNAFEQLENREVKEMEKITFQSTKEWIENVFGKTSVDGNNQWPKY
ncbi:hypothetical protein FXO37_13724 [Capsicum annuum]|nr:hypothetical protein FXO37_13724 [Capsicum annuum]